MTPQRPPRTFQMRNFAWSVVLLLVLAGCTTGGNFAPIPPPEPTPGWTGRFLIDDNLRWASNRDLTRTQFDDRVAAYANRGDMVVDVDMRTENATVRYSLIAHENRDGRNWAMEYDLSSSEYNDAWTGYRDSGYRPLDVEAYMDDGALRFAGVWIENIEGLAWSSTRNRTSADYAEYFTARRGEGYRPIDIEIYPTDAGLRVAAIWYENVDDIDWSQLRNIDRDRYQQEADDLADDGYLMIDYETYEASGDRLYAAIWEKTPNRPAFQIRTNRSSLGFANLWRTYLDEGYRLADFENDVGGDGGLYSGIWIENADRFRYARKSALDTAIDDYRTTNSIPGISVAIIRDGETIYRRGFGNADASAPKVAHSGTVYNAASVSKVVGATLAAKLEAEGALRDGTPVSLDMDRPTSDYIPRLPSQHTHTVEQLTAHLGCVAHYDTTPAITNTTTHFDDAFTASQAIWSTQLVTATQSGASCTVGQTRSYSTPAFTFLGAVLEEVADRSLDELLTEELTQPHGLGSMRVMFSDSTLPSNYERAVPYTSDGTATTYGDSSWKTLGGGLETNVLDLAEFGWRVLDGRIVDAAVRDDRLWTPVDESCTGPGGGTCRNGVGWELRTRSSRRVAEHGGSWTGARSFIRVYRDDGLVIAVMSNARGHNPSALMETLADMVLAP